MSAYLSMMPIEAIGMPEIDYLIENAVRENSQLEFKRDIYPTSDKGHTEFLKDMTALANTQGGHLVIGIAEQDGEAASISPVVTGDPDSEKLRLENVLRDGSDPRIIGVQMHDIRHPDGGFLLVIRVPNSWNQPHRVLKHNWQFYGRNSAGVYSMDVGQLRDAFTRAGGLEERVRQFRASRIALVDMEQLPAVLRKLPSMLQTDDGPIATAPQPGPLRRGLMMLHVVPLSRAVDGFDMTRAIHLVSDFRPVFHEAQWQDRRPNLDGLLTLAGRDDDGSVSAYGLLFRHGSFETARSVMQEDGQLQLGLPKKALMVDVPRVIFGLVKMGYSAPFFVMLSLIGVKGCRPAADMGVGADRHILAFEPEMIDQADLGAGWPARMKPILDGIWNAFGVDRAP